MTLVPQPPAHIPAGWYPHPQNPMQQQYWDGAAWTPAVAPAAQLPSAPAPPQPTGPAQYAPAPAQPPVLYTQPTPYPNHVQPTQPSGQQAAYGQQPGYGAQPYAGQPYPGHPYPVAYVQPLKQTGTAYLFAILLSGFGAHQFYLGNVGAGIGFIALWWGGWALSFIGIGFIAIVAAFVWWIVDLCTMQSQVDAANRRLIAYPY